MRSKSTRQGPEVKEIAGEQTTTKDLPIADPVQEPDREDAARAKTLDEPDPASPEMVLAEEPTTNRPAQEPAASEPDQDATLVEHDARFVK